ncbi:MAG: endopeptidase La [Ruminococcaceae bacterium]|nr:endopeptidase La [Oscillospiraceae bacterium]
MPAYIEKAEMINLPVVALKGVVAFPAINFNIELTDEKNIAAAETALSANSHVLLLTMKDPSSEIRESALFSVGTVAKIKQSVKSGEGTLRILAEGYSRATALTFTEDEHLSASVMCKTITLDGSGGVKGEAYMREAIQIIERIMASMPSLPDDLLVTAKAIDNPGMLADFIAANIMVRTDDKQRVLECFEPLKRIETLVFLLSKEAAMLEYELVVHKKVRERLGEAQKERYLREQLAVIEDELGDGSDEQEYYQKIMSANLPDEIRDKLLRENERMARAQFGSAEASVLRNYLDVCLELPWAKATTDRLDIATARKILDADHDGLEKVKERILEYLAVKQLNPELKNQIICLVGPPGTGKTSVARSIARAMHRKYVRVSLGGIHDESDIRGHRKTYIASMPGRIINALIQVKVKNPLMLLDEIDKMTANVQGDPASAMLEVLDPEQNKYFRDHFVEIPFDLSDCLFICTANSLAGIPKPLIDRMEIIELSSYTRREKLSIAKNHLLPKQKKRHGLNGASLRVSDDALYEIIDFYTREAGVRGLEREIASLCRRCAMKLVENPEKKRITVAQKDVEAFLGARKVLPDTLSERDEVGVVNGLAYTEVGGDMLRIEVAILDGTGKLELTGSLGDVMKESARAAISYIRSIASELSIPNDFYKTKDIHIHVPEGAVPKDGPSAGITMMTALVSALTDRPVRHEVAMTGEITLRGNVLAIGGLREKTMAAYARGIKKVIIPKDNEKDLEKIDPEARAALTFLPVRHASEVLQYALCSAKSTDSPRKAVKKEENKLEIPFDDIKTIKKGDTLGA